MFVLYSTLCVCHHLIHCLPGSGDDCTQNRCTVLAQTKQALCDIICSLMNTINVIENGRAGKYASYAKQHPLGGRSKGYFFQHTIKDTWDNGGDHSIDA